MLTADKLQTGGLKCGRKMPELSATVITSPLCSAEVWETNLTICLFGRKELM